MTPDDLVELLDNVEGIRSVSVDEAKVNTPGIWVRPVGLRRDTLNGHWIETVSVRLLASDKDAKRVRKELLDLFALVMTVIDDPDGDPTFGFVVRPSTGQPVPALIFPLDLI